MLDVNSAPRPEARPEMPPAVSLAPGEVRRLKWLIFALLCAVSLPYLWTQLITPPGFVYGGLLFSPDDQNVHMMWARQAAEGHLFFEDLFTTEHLSTGEKPLFTNLLIGLIGLLSHLPGLPLVVVYHLVRLGACVLLLWWFYRLTARLSDDTRVRFFATALAAFSSGGGWLRDVLPSLSQRAWMDRPDNYVFDVAFPMMPEGFAFPSLFIFPLNAASLALLALIYDCVLRLSSPVAMPGGESDKNASPPHIQRALWIGAGASLLLANIHTYDALPVGTTLLLWALYNLVRRPPGTSRATILAPLLVALGAVPGILYQVYVFRNSREFQLKAVTVTAPPPLPDVLLSYAPLLILALWGMWILRHNRAAHLLMLWALVTLAAIYAPLSFGRKMIEGFHLPLCFFAAVAVVELVKNRVRPARRILIGSAAALLCLSSVQFALWGLVDAPKSITLYRGSLPPLYLSQGDAGALAFLRAQYARDKTDGKPPAAVLSLNLLGNYLPRETGYHAYLGHWAETLNFGQKMAYTRDFYKSDNAPTDTTGWMDFLRRNRIRYVIEGYYEIRVFGKTSATRDLLGTPLYTSPPTPEDADGTRIYAVPEK